MGQPSSTTKIVNGRLKSMKMAAPASDDAYLSRDELERLQAEEALEQGDRAGVRDDAAVDDVVARPLREVGGIPLYDSPPRRAAALAAEMVRRRPFASCNRRTAVAAIFLWLEREGWYLQWTPEQVAEQIDRLATSGITEHQFYLWLTRMSRRRPGDNPGADPGVRRIGSRASFDPGPLTKPPKFLVDPPDLGR
jgi:death on curing protein